VIQGSSELFYPSFKLEIDSSAMNKYVPDTDMSIVIINMWT